MICGQGDEILISTPSTTLLLKLRSNTTPTYNAKDRVRPAAALVHLRAARLALLVAALQQIYNHRLVAHHALLVRHRHLAARPRNDLRLVLRVEQIVQPLVVDLDVADAQQELSVAQLLDLVENLAHRQQHDARLALVAEHRVRFARARLAVGENRAVETLQRGVHDRLGDLVEHVRGAGVLVEDVICACAAIIIEKIIPKSTTQIRTCARSLTEREAIVVGLRCVDQLNGVSLDAPQLRQFRVLLALDQRPHFDRHLDVAALLTADCQFASAGAAAADTVGGARALGHSGWVL